MGQKSISLFLLFISIIIGCERNNQQNVSEDNDSTEYYDFDYEEGPITYEYNFEDFSDKYSAKLFSETKESSNQPGKICVYDKKTKKELISVESKELSFTLDKKHKEVKTNTLDGPYGEESPLMYMDVNFDNIPDIIIMNGHNSPYCLPSFNVYLDKSGKLVYSPQFTRLASQYCGMFAIDSESETINTMVKSGCCWHQYCTFVIANDTPQIAHITEISNFTSPFQTIYNEEYDKRGKLSKKEENTTIAFFDENYKELFSFKLQKNEKRAVLYTMNDKNLYYMLLRNKDTVEFKHPKGEANEVDFTINWEERKFAFSNEYAKYQIYEYSESSEVGIKVEVGGKTYDLKGDYSTLKGSLLDINDFKNVKYEKTE